MTQSSAATLTALLNTVSNMKSILLASNFLIIGHALQNLGEIVTSSGKWLRFVENKTAEDYFETTLTHLKLFQNFTGSLSKKTFVMHTSRQTLSSWFNNDDFPCYHSGEVAFLLFSPIRPRPTHHYQCDVT